MIYTITLVKLFKKNFKCYTNIFKYNYLLHKVRMLKERLIIQVVILGQNPCKYYQMQIFNHYVDEYAKTRA